MLIFGWAIAWWVSGSPWLTTPVPANQVIWNWSAWLVALVAVAFVDVVIQK